MAKHLAPGLKVLNKYKVTQENIFSLIIWIFTRSLDVCICYLRIQMIISDSFLFFFGGEGTFSPIQGSTLLALQLRVNFHLGLRDSTEYWGSNLDWLYTKQAFLHCSIALTQKIFPDVDLWCGFQKSPSSEMFPRDIKIGLIS